MKVGDLLFGALIGIIVFLLLNLALSGVANAQDKAGMRLPNGAVIILTDDKCDLLHPTTHKVMEGFKARGEYNGQTNPACWVFKKGLIYILFYTPDGKGIEGLNYYSADSFHTIVGS